MIEVVYNWFHLPERCTFPHHEREFVVGQSRMQFLDDREVLDQFTRWNGQGAVRCFQYAPTSVERVPHER